MSNYDEKVIMEIKVTCGNHTYIKSLEFLPSENRLDKTIMKSDGHDAVNEAVQLLVHLDYVPSTPPTP
jgi:hypothetical protein